MECSLCGYKSKRPCDLDMELTLAPDLRRIVCSNLVWGGSELYHQGDIVEVIHYSSLGIQGSNSCGDCHRGVCLWSFSRLEVVVVQALANIVGAS